MQAANIEENSKRKKKFLEAYTDCSLLLLFVSWSHTLLKWEILSCRLNTLKSAVDSTVLSFPWKLEQGRKDCPVPRSHSIHYQESVSQRVKQKSIKMSFQ